MNFCTVAVVWNAYIRYHYLQRDRQTHPTPRAIGEEQDPSQRGPVRPTSELTASAMTTFRLGFEGAHLDTVAGHRTQSSKAVYFARNEHLTCVRSLPP